MTELTAPLPSLSPVNGKAVTARFDGESLSSDAGVLALREVDLRLDVAAGHVPARHPVRPHGTRRCRPP